VLQLGTQDERAARLLARLGAELTRRQDLLAAGGFAGIAEQRSAAPPGDRLPHVLLLLDQWEGFTTTLGEAGGGTLIDVITRILAEGASAGIHLVMTGDRSLLAGRIAAMCEDKLVFKLAEKDDWTTGSHSLTIDDWVVRGDARGAVTAFTEAAEAWRATLLTADDAALSTVGWSAYPNGSDPEDVFIDTVWWVNQEILHHGAEIALLRDLYRAK